MCQRRVVMLKSVYQCCKCLKSLIYTHSNFLHSLKIRLFLPLSLFILSSCTTDIEEKQGPLGAEVASTDLQKKVDAVFQDITLLDATVNEYVEYEDNYKVDRSPVTRTANTRHTLIDRKKDSEKIVFVLFQNLETYKSDGRIDEKKDSELEPIVYRKVEGPSSPSGTPSPTHSELGGFAHFGEFSAMYSNRFRSNSTQTQASPIRTQANTCDGEDEKDSQGRLYDCLRFFNLKTRTFYEPAPVDVANKPNCMNIPNCKILVRSISYDAVKWRRNQIVHRVSIEAKVAPMVPDLMYEFTKDGDLYYSPPVLSYCERDLREIESQKYYVSVCKVLRDFQI
jgi:hypothetical protein